MRLLDECLCGVLLPREVPYCWAHGGTGGFFRPCGPRSSAGEARCVRSGSPEFFPSASLPCPDCNPKRCAEAAPRPPLERQPPHPRSRVGGPARAFRKGGRNARKGGKGADTAGSVVVSASCREPGVRGPCGRAEAE